MGKKWYPVAKHMWCVLEDKVEDKLLLVTGFILMYGAQKNSFSFIDFQSY